MTSQISRSKGAVKQLWQQIGECFVQYYYNTFDNSDRKTLGSLYTPGACLTWEGSPYAGREAIAVKLSSLPFKRIKHIITEQDCQPAGEGAVVIMVFGQLQADDDPPLAFHQVFMLRGEGSSWACTNDVFRLGIHNIPV